MGHITKYGVTASGKVLLTTGYFCPRLTSLKSDKMGPFLYKGAEGRGLEGQEEKLLPRQRLDKKGLAQRKYLEKTFRINISLVHVKIKTGRGNTFGSARLCHRSCYNQKNPNLYDVIE